MANLCQVYHSDSLNVTPAEEKFSRGRSIGDIYCCAGYNDRLATTAANHKAVAETPKTFQDLILALQAYWSRQESRLPIGCPTPTQEAFAPDLVNLKVKKG